MATISNAITQLQKAGARVSRDGHKIIGQMKAARIEVTEQGIEAISFYVIKNGAQDDLLTDYFAGSWRKNIKQAIKLAERMETW